MGARRKPGVTGFVIQKYIRDRASRRYLTRKGAWTKERSRAWAVACIGEAADAAERFKPNGVEVFFWFGEEPANRRCAFAIAKKLSAN